MTELATQELVTTATTLTPEEVALAANIRATLPGQRNADRVDEARLQYRTVSFRALSRRVRRTLPFRWFRMRQLHTWQIEEYPRAIPDSVLLKYAAARDTGLFRGIFVFEPSYEAQAQMAPVSRDPWLVGKVSGRYNFSFENADQMAVIAYWE